MLNGVVVIFCRVCRRWPKLYGGRSDVLQQRCVEARAMPDLCVRQRNHPVWRRSVRWLDQLREGVHSTGRVLSQVPEWLRQQLQPQHVRQDVQPLAPFYTHQLCKLKQLWGYWCSFSLSLSLSLFSVTGGTVYKVSYIVNAAWNKSVF